MERTDIINLLAEKIHATTYLEIGVRRRDYNFNKVNIANKTGVDPGREGYSEGTHEMTSDDFFEQNTQHYDIVFIDGLHEAHQVARDISNALMCLNNNGYIVCHDMNPVVEERQLSCSDPRRQEYVLREREKGNPEYGLWNGDCWKAWMKFRSRGDLDMCVVDTDFGCGVISKSLKCVKTVSIPDEHLTYHNLHTNRNEWLNLISVDQFTKIF